MSEKGRTCIYLDGPVYNGRQNLVSRLRAIAGYPQHVSNVCRLSDLVLSFMRKAANQKRLQG
jgi:hypothetical protein